MTPASWLPSGTILAMPLATTSPTPPWVKTTPSIARNWGSIPIGPTCWSIRSDCATTTGAGARVRTQARTRARIDAMPIAIEPDWSPNGAQVENRTAIAARESAGANSQFPSRRACAPRSSGVPSSNVPVLTPRARDNPPMARTMTPASRSGSTAPNANVMLSSSQNAAVVTRRGFEWSRNARMPVTASRTPMRTKVASRSPGPRSLIAGHLAPLSVRRVFGQPPVDVPEMDGRDDGGDENHRQRRRRDELRGDVVAGLRQGADDQQDAGGGDEAVLPEEVPDVLRQRALR